MIQAPRSQCGRRSPTRSNSLGGSRARRPRSTCGLEAPIRIEWQDGEFDDGTVQVVEAPSRFVFLWHGAGFDSPQTRVEFTLEAVEGGTRLLVVESGFSKVREVKRASAWKDNDGGWTHELDELKEYLEAA